MLVFDHANGVACVANCGDTRAVVSRLHTALDITRDMKATDPMEVARIVRGSGYVVNGRVLGSLAIARSLGDKNLKDSPTNSLIPDPEVTSFSVSLDDEFIVIASDGLWDVMSSQVPYVVFGSLCFVVLLSFIRIRLLCCSYLLIARRMLWTLCIDC